MGINYESRQIGTVRAIQLCGAEAVGGSQLRFSLAWLLFPKSIDGMYTVLNTSVWISVLHEGTPAATVLGQAVPETAWCEECRDGQPFERNVTYRMTLPHAQLLGLEELRRGRGVNFLLEVRGNSHGSNGLRAIDETLQLAVNASDWGRVLKEANAAEVLLVGVQLPVDDSVPGTRAALDLVRRANDHLTFGSYDAAVAECRRAIESVWILGNLKREADAARKSMASGNDQRRMTKRERELALGEALKNFCNSAHHVGDDAEPEIFGRTDAALVVAGTAGLISSLIASPDWIAPSNLVAPNRPATSAVPVESNLKAVTPAPPSPAASAGMPSLTDQVTKARQHLESQAKNRPRTLQKLRSAMESLFAKKLAAEQLTVLVAELVKRKIVVDAGGKLSYPKATK